jgi:uncharacterized protein
VAILRINISKLSEGEHNYPFEAEPAEIGLGEEFTGKVTVEAALQKSPRQVFLHVEARTSGTFACDRCLEDVKKNVNAHYDILYVTQNKPDEGEEKNAEVQVITPDINYLDLDEDVRQYLTLAVPAKRLCQDDCRGLCPICGVNRNTTPCSCAGDKVDPRWEALKKFSEN